MNDELLYEVDEHDGVIGPRARGVVHGLGLRHRAVHILVFNDLREILLQKRSRTKDVNPGLWDTSAAGHVDWGESYDDCAVRELGEELGVPSRAPLQFLFKLPASEQTGWEFVHVYRAVHSGELQLNRGEIDECRWFNPDELDAWVNGSGIGLTSSFRLIWQTYRVLEAAG
ncbi:NUDIX hydrolase [Methylocaldum sp.]|uniref:NUDIX hydrolase n=1 Tax=Methylocaldum sp. TaxID=1969727 RepID=UPI002D6264B0|nr:NUDIX domain-containing protein [Methylocaldum sp.]HYE35291.1 NUDIX domain-containing protein [Methylocaldum sp.]